MNDLKLKKIISWGDPKIKKFLYCPKDGAHYIILNDGSWQFVDQDMVKMYGADYEIKDNSIFFNYSMIVPNPNKNRRLKKEDGFYELYLAENLLGWGESNVHYFNHGVNPWDCDDRIYVELISAKLDPESCTEKYKKLLHGILSKPIPYDSEDVARYYVNLRTDEAYILLAGGAWQFLEKNDDTGSLFVSEYGIDYSYYEKDSVMDMDIFCSRKSEFEEWTYADPDDDAGFSLYEFQNFFGKGESYISYDSEKKLCSLDSMFFEILDFNISPKEARTFFGYDINTRGEFAISKQNLNSENEYGEIHKKKFGILQTSIAFAFMVLLVSGFYYMVLKIIPGEFGRDSLIVFSAIWLVLLSCFIFPFLAAKNQYIEISKKRFLYSNMFGKKTEYEFKDILGINHISHDGKFGKSILIFPKNGGEKIITLYEVQCRKFSQVDEILTINLDEITPEEYFDYISAHE